MENIDTPVSDKINFKIIKVKRDKDGHFIMKKRTLHQEDITLPNIYAPNQGAPKIYRATTHRTKGRNRPKHNHSWGP